MRPHRDRQVRVHRPGSAPPCPTTAQTPAPPRPGTPERRPPLARIRLLEPVGVRRQARPALGDRRQAAIAPVRLHQVVAVADRRVVVQRPGIGPPRARHQVHQRPRRRPAQARQRVHVDQHRRQRGDEARRAPRRRAAGTGCRGWAGTGTRRRDTRPGPRGCGSGRSAAAPPRCPRPGPGDHVVDVPLDAPAPAVGHEQQRPAAQCRASRTRSRRARPRRPGSAWTNCPTRAG